MPFTFSHPAVIVPIAKKHGNFSAFVIGSMAPDFDNFFPGLPFFFEGHMIHGLWTFCVPLGFIVWFLFQKVIKKPILSFFPSEHQLRLANLLGDVDLKFKNIFWVLFSIWLGSLTHIFLDSFTHDYGIFVHLIPFLRSVVFSTANRSFQVYHLFQFGFGILGVLLLVYWYWRWYQKAPRLEMVPAPYMKHPSRWLILGIILFNTLAGGVLLALSFTTRHFSFYYLYYFLRASFLIASALFIIQVLLFSIILWGWQKTHP